MNTMEDHSPIDKLDQRVFKNFLSATVMLGHLCALYDRGIYEAGRLMSNLLFQLAVKRKSNTPLLEQVGVYDNFRLIVTTGTRNFEMSENHSFSPLVSLMWGLKNIDKQNPTSMIHAAFWLPDMLSPSPPKGFESIHIDEWLDDPIIPTSEKTLSRRELIAYVRDQDGGAHSDSDKRLSQSSAYIDLVNSFPISKQSHLNNNEQIFNVWNMLPPVTMPILRQISHEMVSAVFSQFDIAEYIPPPCIVSIFNDGELYKSYIPDNYPNIGKVYGITPKVVISD